MGKLDGNLPFITFNITTRAPRLLGLLWLRNQHVDIIDAHLSPLEWIASLDGLTR